MRKQHGERKRAAVIRRYSQLHIRRATRNQAVGGLGGGFVLSANFKNHDRSSLPTLPNDSLERSELTVSRTSFDKI